jgi:hypothetical protein
MDTPAQMTPLWSDQRISSFSGNASTAFEARHLFDAMRRVRDDYEAERQRLIAELAESQAYALQLERALGEAWEPVPDGRYELENSVGDRDIYLRLSEDGKRLWQWCDDPTISEEISLGSWGRDVRLCERRTSSSPTPI